MEEGFTAHDSPRICANSTADAWAWAFVCTPFIEFPHNLMLLCCPWLDGVAVNIWLVRGERRGEGVCGEGVCGKGGERERRGGE